MFFSHLETFSSWDANSQILCFLAIRRYAVKLSNRVEPSHPSFISADSHTGEQLFFLSTNYACARCSTRVHSDDKIPHSPLYLDQIAAHGTRRKKERFSINRRC